MSTQTQTKVTDKFGNVESVPRHIEENTREMFEVYPSLDVGQIGRLVAFWGSSEAVESEDLMNYVLDRLRAKQDGAFSKGYNLDSEVYQSGRRAFKATFGYEPMGEIRE